MDFRQHQEDAARDTRRLAVLYGLAVVAVVGAFHLGSLWVWSLLTNGSAPPIGFFAINLLATAGLILGGSLIEYDRLQSRPTVIADRLGARQLEPGAARLDLAERRLLNLVEEMALASHQPVPRVYLLDRDLTINALTTGMRREEATLMVTRGALERLARDELQGVIAHEVAHLASGDVVLQTRTFALVTGLELVHDAGKRAFRLGYIYAIPGALLVACGWLGHLAGLILAAAMSRSREWHADAEAVRLTRLAKGLAGALRKAQWLASQPDGASGTLNERSAALLRPAMFQIPGKGHEWFATHPPLAARVQRLLGRSASPLPCPLRAAPNVFSGGPAPAADARSGPAVAAVATVAAGGAVSPVDVLLPGLPGLPGLLGAGSRFLAPPEMRGQDPAAGGADGVAEADPADPARSAYSADKPASADKPGPADRADAPRTDRDEEDVDVSWLADRGLPALDYAPVQPIEPDNAARLVVLARAAHEPTRAAALATLLILGAGIETDLWPNRWRAAAALQVGLADELKAIGPERVETLRWPLLELAGATLRPLARPWREDLLWLLRTQIDLDQRVTLVEWVYYLLLRVRLMSLSEAAWPGDETSTDPAAAVRWIVNLLAKVSQQTELRAERLANDVIRQAHLSRTGRDHPPIDVGGLQSAVGALRRLPDLQRPLLMRELAGFLPPDAPVEARDFLRVLAIIIDTPIPLFPVNRGASKGTLDLAGDARPRR